MVACRLQRGVNVMFMTASMVPSESVRELEADFSQLSSVFHHENLNEMIRNVVYG